eukprot:scaffold47798_cov47-Phaeocystis_antarctica.AAC.3
MAARASLPPGGITASRSEEATDAARAAAFAAAAARAAAEPGTAAPSAALAAAAAAAAAASATSPSDLAAASSTDLRIALRIVAPRANDFKVGLQPLRSEVLAPLHPPIQRLDVARAKDHGRKVSRLGLMEQAQRALQTGLRKHTRAQGIRRLVVAVEAVPVDVVLVGLAHCVPAAAP